MVRMRSRVQAPIVAPYETLIRRDADLFHSSFIKFINLTGFPFSQSITKTYLPLCLKWSLFLHPAHSFLIIFGDSPHNLTIGGFLFLSLHDGSSSVLRS